MFNLYNPIIMEMQDPSLAPEQPQAEEQSLNNEAAAEAATTVAETFETVIDPENAEASIDPEAAAEELADDAEMQQAEEIVTAPADATKQSVIDALKQVLEKDADKISREEVSHLRGIFAAIRKKDTDAAKAQWIENGGDPEEFAEAEDEADAEFKSVLNAIKDKKAAWTSEQDAIRAANLERKNAIIAEIIALAEDTDNVNRTFPRYRELQDEFNAIGAVPQPEETVTWKRFQDARERYSDNLKINKELRDYDFKKNLDSKLLLIDQATELDAENDVITAFKRLQDLHTKWREIGPVAKELREDIWTRFKDASAVINKKYQAHFEERKAREQENEAGKTAICERVEALDFSTLKTFAAWEEMTKQIIAAQEEWKKFGFASKKMNNVLFARFRATCDKFFTEKAEYFKQVKEDLARNLARKTALAEKAEALKDSTDWKTATDEFVAMQKEWKTIGTVAKKHSDAVWNRFQTACDFFFEQKKKATSGTRKAEQENLKAKRALIAELDTITTETPKDEAIAKLRDIQARWQEIGHVPFKEKDKTYNAYRSKINEIRTNFDIKESRAAMDRYESTVAEIEGDENKLYRERERLMRVLDAKRQELRTYENNLGFLSSKSKTGESMMREFAHKIDRLKADIVAVEEKVRLVDSKL